MLRFIVLKAHILLWAKYKYFAEWDTSDHQHVQLSLAPPSQTKKISPSFLSSLPNHPNIFHFLRRCVKHREAATHIILVFWSRETAIEWSLDRPIVCCTFSSTRRPKEVGQRRCLSLRHVLFPRLMAGTTGRYNTRVAPWTFFFFSSKIIAV